MVRACVNAFILIVWSARSSECVTYVCGERFIPFSGPTRRRRRDCGLELLRLVLRFARSSLRTGESQLAWIRRMSELRFASCSRGGESIGVPPSGVSRNSPLATKTVRGRKQLLLPSARGEPSPPPTGHRTRKKIGGQTNRNDD